MKLSICCITYNHAQFIEQAVEGFLMQETDFDFEIIISDDCSKDDTQKILSELKQRHPEKIKLILNENNIGMMPNFSQAVNACKGKYIALCEGDDYWTDSSKLKKQVVFLESNPDISFCFHPVRELEPGGELQHQSFGTPHIGPIFTVEDLAYGNFIHTPSLVFRRPKDFKIPPQFAGLAVGDYPLLMLLASHSNFARLPDVMAVYRRGVGIWSTVGRKQMILKWSAMLTVLQQVYADKELVLERLLNQHMTLLFEVAGLHEKVEYPNVPKSNNLMATLDEMQTEIQQLRKKNIDQTSSSKMFVLLVHRVKQKLKNMARS